MAVVTFIAWLWLMFPSSSNIPMALSCTVALVVIGNYKISKIKIKNES